MLLFKFLIINRNVDLNFCDIKGNVERPGVYLVDEGEVINDIIVKAGGLKKNSYVKNINLSKKVTDEMVINIMTIEEYENLTKECPICECEVQECEQGIMTTTKIKTELTKNTSTTVYESTLPTTTVKAIESSTRKVTELTTAKITETTYVTELTTTNESDLKVNINNATIEELMELPGIGQATAQKIIDYRNSKLFETIEDILNVKGIGDGLFKKIKDYIEV